MRLKATQCVLVINEQYCGTTKKTVQCTAFTQCWRTEQNRLWFGGVTEVPENVWAEIPVSGAILMICAKMSDHRAATRTAILWEEIQTCYSQSRSVASPFSGKKKNKLADFRQLSFSEISAPTENKDILCFLVESLAEHWIRDDDWGKLFFCLFLSPPSVTGRKIEPSKQRNQLAAIYHRSGARKGCLVFLWDLFWTKTSVNNGAVLCQKSRDLEQNLHVCDQKLNVCPPGEHLSSGKVLPRVKLMWPEGVMNLMA